MGVVLRNLQKVVPLRRARLRKDVETLRHILGIHKFDLGIVCVDNHRIQHINNVYRKKNVPTDVLSFPFYEDLRPGKLPCPFHRDELNLGDIFLGVEFVMEQCKEDSLDLHGTLARGSEILLVASEWGGGVRVCGSGGLSRTLGSPTQNPPPSTTPISTITPTRTDPSGPYLVVTAHGICHLLGYRHETEEEWTEMLQKESYILNEYNRLTGRNLEPLMKRCAQDR